MPIDPSTAILEAFRSHSLVALKDPHGDEQMQAFLLSLLRHPDFVARVNDIVVEPASAKYQALMDKYTAGGEVDPVALREAWRNTSASR